VAPDRLRFDFSHFKPLSPAEIKQVEDWVNEGILQNVGLDISQKSMQDAVAAGAMALFGEKYGDTVRVIDIPGLSTELCGGTHVRRTGDIGSFKIVSESGIQAGVRRIEASTGLGTLELLRGQEDQLRELAGVLKVGTQEVPRRVQRLLDEKRDLEKQIEVLTRKLAQGGGAASVADRTRDIGGIKVISMACEIDDPKALREQADRLRDSLGSGVVILGARGSDKVTVLVAVTKDLLGRLHAGNIVKEVAKGVDGSGGGRPDLAQAGGKSPEKLDATLDAAFDVVQAML
jgi:alanyl-tRNA synthetase